MKKKAVGYCRYSSDKQREESIIYQAERITQYCEENDLELTFLYCDDAKNGTNTERENLQKMLEDSQLSDWNYLVVYKMDRLSRDVGDALTIKKKLHENDIQIISIIEEFDDETPEGSFFNHIVLSMSQYYISNLSRSVMVGLKQNANNAMYTGGLAPLGYAIKDMKYIINEKEAEAVRIIFQKTIEGYSYKEVARYLNANGYISKKGSAFKCTFTELLRNRKYIGEYVYNRQVAKDGRNKRNGHQEKAENEIIRIPGGVPRIIDDITFYKVQDILTERKQARNRPGAKYLLSGLLRCSLRYRSISGNVAFNNLLQKHQYTYKCTNKNIPHHFKRTDMFRLDKYVIDTTLKLFNKKNISKLTKLINKQIEEHKKSLHNELLILSEKIKEVSNEVVELNSKTSVYRKSMLNELNEKIGEYMTLAKEYRIKHLRIEMDLDKEIKINPDIVLKNVEEIYNELKSKDKAIMKRSLTSITQKIYCSNETAEIKYSFNRILGVELNFDIPHSISIVRDYIIYPNRMNKN